MVIQALRDNIPKWVTGVILFVIIGPFALWGINSYFTAASDTSVAKVNGDEISPGDFERAYQGQYQRLQQMYGAAFRPGMIDEKELRQQTLDSMINQTLLEQQVAKQHYAISDDWLREEIAKLPAFQIDGKFSEKAYEATLAANGISPAEFERRNRQNLILGQIQASIQDSAIAMPAEFTAAVALRDQQRQIGYISISTNRFLAEAQPTDKDVEAYYKAHGDEFMTPEKVTLSYVELDEAVLAKQVKVDDATLQAQYQQQIKSFQQDETRQARHILIGVSGTDPKADAAAKAKAEDVLKQLQAGGDFAKLAAKYSDDPGSAKQGGELGWVSKGTMVKPFEDALFGLQKPGQMTGLVKSQFGYHIIELEGIRAASVKPFAEVRDQLLTEAQKKQADDSYYKLGDELANLAYEHDQSLDTASQQLNLPIQTVEDVTRDAGTGIAANADVRKAAFSEQVLTQGKNSEPVPVGDNHVVVVRVKGHVPSQPKPLAEVRGEIVSKIKIQQADAAAQKLADSLVAQLKQGADPAQLARSNGIGVGYVQPSFVKRDQSGLPPALLTAAFAAPDPANTRTIESVRLETGDQVVLMVTGAKPGDASALTAQQRVRGMSDLSRQMGEQDFSAYMAWLRDSGKVKVNAQNLQQQDDQ